MNYKIAAIKMKRLSLITLCLLAAITANVQAQTIPHYCELYREGSNKFEGKYWVSGSNFRGENRHDNGTGTTFISRADSAKMYMLNIEKKTYMTLPLSHMKNINNMMGMEVEKERSKQIKLLGQEVVEGKMCDYCEITIVSTLPNGSQEKNTHWEWIYKPLNTWIKYKEGPYERAIVKRNISEGVQPAHLFEIPKDYAVIAIPAGGIMEMIQQSTGASQSDIQQAVDNANRDIKNVTNQMNSIQNDPNKTDQQKIQEALKMLESINKK